MDRDTTQAGVVDVIVSEGLFNKHLSHVTLEMCFTKDVNTLLFSWLL